MLTELMHETKTEQRLWGIFISSLEYAVSGFNKRNELSADVAERFLEIMDDIEEQFFERGFYTSRTDYHADEVYSVLSKIIECRLSPEHQGKESAEIAYKKIFWNLTQDIKRPVKKIVCSEHIFPEEAKELAVFLDYVRWHTVSYSMEHIER